MIFYLASRYSRHDEMRGVRDVLEALGHTVRTGWVDLHGGALATSFAPDALNSDPAGCAAYAQTDLEDLTASDACLSFTCGTGGKGGRHVEFGLALGLGKRCVVVGPREHVFHTLPQVEYYASWPLFVRAVTAGEYGLAVR